MGKHHRFTYQSMTEFVQAASERGLTTHASHHVSYHKTEWTGSESFEQACEYAIHGWTEPRETVEAVLSEVRDHIAEVTHETFVGSFDVAGGEVDIDRYLMREPECMVEYQLQPVATHGKVVRVLVSGGAGAHVAAETIVNRGAAVVALVEALKIAGHSVELWWEQTTANKSALPDHLVTVLVKIAGAEDRVDADGLMFALAHPSMLRRLSFAVREGMNKTNREIFGIRDKGAGSYGYPHKLVTASEIEADVTVDTPQRGEWETITSLTEWVEQTMTGLGLAC